MHILKQNWVVLAAVVVTVVCLPDYSKLRSRRRSAGECRSHVGAGIIVDSLPRHTRTTKPATGMGVCGPLVRQVPDGGDYLSVKEAAPEDHSVAGVSLAELVSDLKNSRAVIRLRAVETIALRRSAVPPALEALLAAAKDRDARIRSTTLAILVQLQDPRITVVLVRALQDKETIVRQSAAKAFVNNFLMHPPCRADTAVTRSLVRALGDEDACVRANAALALGKGKDPCAGKPLLDLVRRTHEETNVRCNAITSLGELRYGPAASVLISYVRGLNDYSPIRNRSVTALGEIGDRRAVIPLVACFRTRDFQTRSSAALALGRLRDPRAVEALSALVSDEAQDVRGSAAWSLGKIGDPRAVPHLIPLLRDEHPFVVANTLIALGEIGDPRPVKSLIPFLHNENSSLRGKAATALGGIGDATAIGPLTSALHDDHFWVRKEAVKSLALIGGPKALGAVRKATKDDHDPRVREAALDAVEELTEHRLAVKE